MSEKRTCAVCGKEFTRNGKILTCSMECAEEYRKRYNRTYIRNNRGAEKLKTMKCPVCGKEFKQIRGNQIVCSSICRKKRTKEMERKGRTGTVKKRTKQVRKSLIDIEKEAKEAGMSYGKYVAMIERS